MEDLLKEIEGCLKAGLHYAAIMLSLSLPDVCAGLESTNGSTSGQKYKVWYKQNLAEKYEWLTAEDCYSLRCSVVHQGKFGHPNLQYSKVLFTMPSVRRITFHNNVVNDALNLDAIIFCNDFVTTTRAWYNTKKSDHNVMKNIPNLVRFRAEGFPPYMGGVPLIA